MLRIIDQPLLNAQDVTALIGAWKKRPEGAAVVFPQVGGERGNPVIVDLAVRGQILAGEAQVGCRQWQAAHPEGVAPFVSDNRRCKVDIDSPEDVSRFAADTGHARRWPAAPVAA